MALLENTKSDYMPYLSSGIETIDSAWGGLFCGGAYLFYGEAAAGRHLLTLLFARAGDEFDEQTIFISSDRYSELKIQSGSLGFDLEAVLASGNLHLVRIPPRMKLREIGDDGVAQALHSLTNPFKSYRPKRIIINDFMPFVAFRSFERFRMEFVRFLERTDALGSTLILGMSEPANEHSRRVIEFMISHLTGAVHIERDAEDPGSTKRKLTLIPTSGHIKRYSFEHWDLEDVVADTPPHFRPSTMQSIRPGDTRSHNLSTLQTKKRLESEAAESFRPGYSHTPLVAPLQASEEEVDGEEVAVVAGKSTASDSAAGKNAEADDAVAIDPLELPVGSGLDVDITDRSSFLKRLERAVASSSEVGDNFVILALRMEQSGDPKDRAIGFEFLLDVAHDILRPHDDMLVDMDGEQLIVFLAHTREDESDQFFTMLRDHLIREAPQRGTDLLTRISAMVSENGRPFSSVVEFVTFAFIRK